MVHEKITNFKNRAEVDYRRPDNARPELRVEEGLATIDTERGQVESGVNAHDPEQWSRFNILHFKSSTKQEEQDQLYRKIRGEK